MKDSNSMLIGDIGSTSADWALVDGDDLIQFSTRGFNPTAHAAAELNSMLAEIELKIKDRSSPKRLFYYGTGVNNQAAKDIVERGFQAFWSLDHRLVTSDILGAARAVCQDQEGVVAILGTGSNACRYGAHHIQEKAINMGYLLADEGSGFDIGRRLVTAYFYGKLPEKLCHIIQDHLPSNPGELVRPLYSHDAPNRYLASFARLAIQNQTDPAIRSIVTSSFQSFINTHKIIYESSQKIHFVGSIAYYFCGILEAELSAAGLEMGSVVQKPIDQLIKYHQKFG